MRWRLVHKVHGLFVPWTVRTVDCSYPPGLFVPRYHGLFVPSLDFSYPGLFVPWTVRTVPSLDDSYHVEKGNIVYTVWVKKSPLRFSDIFFRNGWEFSDQIVQAYCTFIPTVDYKFLFNYLQFWRTYTTLSATTQRAFRPMVDISSIWWCFVSLASRYESSSDGTNSPRYEKSRYRPGSSTRPQLLRTLLL